MKPNVNLHDAVVIVQLNCAFSWGVITDKGISDETTKNKGAVNGSVRARKSLLPDAAGTHIKLLQETLSNFYTYHKKRTLTSGTDGQRCMPTAFYMDYMTEFASAQAETDNAMDALEAAYPNAIKQAQKLLGAAFNPADYPPVQDLKRYLSFRVRFLPMPKGDQIFSALGAAAVADVDAYVQEAVDMATKDATDRLRTCVAHMAERLGNPKAIFRDSLTENLDECVKLLPQLNIGDDPELAALVQKAKDTLAGHDPEVLRTDTSARLNVAKAANDILKRMGGVV